MITLKQSNQILKIEAGELVGYQVEGHQYIHQKGSPGWRNSDTEMFPIIGPTADAGFQVQTPRDVAVQDQHGLLRELEYELIAQTDTTVVYKKTYVARTPVENSKYPTKSDKQFLYWTYDFEFEKKFELTPDHLKIAFTISGDIDTPFMLGYHPAFSLVTENPIVIAGEKAIVFSDILAVGSKAYQVSDCEKIILKDKNELYIKTMGFGSFMLWAEVDNMLCIEPITFYPYAVKPQNLHDGFQYLREKKKVFTVQISVNN
ncbi:FIG00930725: hypothetical protein [hydrothermal vent metagenome]|uniref:Aldose 1-epimerase n=1 Tax=hydrothermal vent metagenome TaxID=652676 RepID=A0A3B0TFC1_9ZZZZ